MSDYFASALLELARAHEANTGTSRARTATIVVNRGSFFEPLESGKTCSLQNFERFLRHYANPGNWKEGVIPAEVQERIEALGKDFSDTISNAASVADAAGEAEAA